MKIQNNVILSLIFGFVSLIAFAQTEGYIPNKNPITPTTFQFIKYTEIPVNEYNGIPDITIPIYTIEAGSIKFPIELKYHAGGVRIAEEASWVGLGWDLNIGSITQIVNDRDDLGKFTFMMPDYFEFTTPYVFPYEDLCGYTTPPGSFPTPSIISQSHPKYSIIKYTNYRIPVGGYPTSRMPLFFNASGWSNGDHIDSEPDVFKVICNGHYLEFLINPMGEIRLLNKKGYKISKTDLGDNKIGWKIISPDGMQYFFEKNTQSSLQLSETKVWGMTSSRVEAEIPILSRSWYLTKITGFDNRELVITYSATNGLISEFPSFSQTFKYMHTGDEQGFNCWNGDHAFAEEVRCSFPHGCASPSQFPIFNSNQVYQDSGFFSAKYFPTQKLYISEITFPTGKIIFHTSVRDDILNDAKLDSIEIKGNNNDLINRFGFGYGYFIGENEGLGFDSEPGLLTMGNKSLTEKLYRLKLIKLKALGQPAYHFLYNSTQLPSKCSYATDYWGFYNGKTTNTSLIPDPQDLGLQIGNFGNNHKPELGYASAGTLDTLIYPTGGYIVFNYELNNFTQSLIPNLSTGNGIRIKTITHKDADNLVHKTNYFYEGGIPFTPLKLLFNYGYSRNRHVDYDESYIDYILSIDCIKITSSGFYSSCLLGSGNGIGYSKVIKENVDNQGNSNGKIIHYYHNNPDEIPVCEESMDLTLPPRKDEYHPVNGSLYKEEIWHKNNYPLKITENEYVTTIPVVYYGARVGYANLIGCGIIAADCEYQVNEQNYVGYYPIYTLNSLLTQTKVTEYQNSGPSIVNNIQMYYDVECDNIRIIEKYNSEEKRVEEDYFYPYSDEIMSEPGMGFLRHQNRINHPVMIRKLLDNSTISEVHENYDQFTLKPPLTGQQTWMKLYNTKLYDDDPITDASVLTVIMDEYDNFGNVIQSHKQDNNNISTLWGYDNIHQIIIAENCSYTDLESSVNTITGDISTLLGNIGDMTTDAQKTQWKNFNVALRANSLLSNANITSYTYKPLVGITSETDPAGIASYYEYDDQGRLTLERDNWGNIIKKYDYHFASQ